MLVQWFWPVVVCVSLLGSWSLGSKFSWHLPCSISQFLMIYEDCLACTDPLHVATLILRSKETFLVTATELSENKSSQISLEIRKCRHWRKIKTGLWPHDNVSNLLIVWQKRLKIEVFRVALSFLWDHVNFSHERWRDLHKITTSVPLQGNALWGLSICTWSLWSIHSERLTEDSLWKLIKCSLSSLHWRNLKTEQ